jgi:hypothetical protein
VKRPSSFKRMDRSQLSETTTGPNRVVWACWRRRGLK